MNKGLIMEIKDEYVIVLNDNGIMERIELKPGMEVGQKIFYFADDIVEAAAQTSPKNKNYKIYNLMKTFGSMAALFLLVFTFFHNITFDKTYAVVSLDINPSIQIEADSNQNIIKVEGMNDDGKNIDFGNLKGININDGIQKIKDILIEKQYLETNKDVLVAFAFVKNDDNSGYEDTVKEAVFSTFKTENVAYLKAESKEDIVEAKEQGISLGRYEAYKVVDDETKKKINNAPVKDITAQIKDNVNVIYLDGDTKEEYEDKKPEDSTNVSATPEKVDTKPSASEAEDSTKNTTNNNDNKSTNAAASNNNGSTTEKPASSVPSEKNEDSNVTNGKVEESNSEAKKDEGVLELEPENPDKDSKPNQSETKPEQKPEQESSKTDSENGKLENNTTSGKFEEDTESSKDVVEVPKEEVNSVK